MVSFATSILPRRTSPSTSLPRQQRPYPQHLGERSCAYVISRTPSPAATELREFLRQRGLAAYKIPDRFEFVSRFPETAIGKVRRMDLRTGLDKDKDNQS
ncbi:AMP-binding enzyme [Rhodococcus sp. 27YEA15]|uniref:AMP-binding enzyme n=1 Tax=Rhodococcus sp. 27YEA15 TaxID=3156259 RepID=UPI003C7EC10A